MLRPDSSYFKLSNTGMMGIALIPISYILSFYLLSYYTDGDQIYYHYLYEALYGSNIQDATALSISHTGGIEPLTAFILWIGANLDIEKNIYISILNVILIVCLFLVARKNHVKMPMIFLLLTNFYVVVLLSSAERLKIAYIFLIIAMLFVGKVRLFLLACSPFAHLQSAVLLAGVVFAYIYGFIKSLIFNFHVTKRLILPLIGLAIASAIIGYFLFKGVSNKFESYSEFGSLRELINILILMLIAIYVSRKRLRMFLLLIPLIMAIMIIGGTRVNMIAFTLVIYSLMEERRLNHPLVYLLMVYFSFKTIGYIERVFTTGQGF